MVRGNAEIIEDKKGNYNIVITSNLLIHEQCHGKQQEYNDVVAKLWWIAFLEDPQFRLEQEVAAYAAEYRFICAKIKDRNQRNAHLGRMARLLSSPLYKCDITYFRAMTAIKVGRLDVPKAVQLNQHGNE